MPEVDYSNMNHNTPVKSPFSKISLQNEIIGKRIQVQCVNVPIALTANQISLQSEDSTIKKNHDVNQIKKSKNLKIIQHPWKTKGLTFKNYFALSAFMMTDIAVGIPLITTIIPMQLDMILEKEDLEKGAFLGLILFWSSILSIILCPLFGAISDRCTLSIGRRKPFIILAGVLMPISLFGMCFSQTSISLLIFFCIYSSATYISAAPYTALVPDVLPEHNLGTSSGYLGIFGIVGSLIGCSLSAGISVIGHSSTYALMGILYIICSFITVYFVPEIQNKPNYEEYYWCKFFEIFTNHDFLCVFSSRFWMQLGILGLQQQIQYYLKDSIPNDDFSVWGFKIADSAEDAVCISIIALLCGAIISAPLTGIFADYINSRKALLYVSSFVMAISFSLISISPSFGFSMTILCVAGFGFGMFLATDYAMVLDVLPNSKHYGKDMGLWNLSLTCPQIISAPLIGNMLDFFRNEGDVRIGWIIVLHILAVSIIFGAFLLKYSTHIR